MKRLAPVILLALVGMSCKREPTPDVKTPAAETGSAGSAAARSENSPAAAPTPTPAKDPWAAAPEPAAKTIDRPLLWSIEKNGITSYAFGTMHLGVDPDQLPKIVWDKLESEPAFGMETDTTHVQSIGLGARDHGTIHEDLGPVYYKKLQDLLGATMVSRLDTMKPVMPAVMLSMRGLKATLVGLDTALRNRAETKHKQLVFFEPAQTQVALLEKWMDVKALKLMIDTADESLAMTKNMAKAYLDGDAAKLLAINDSWKPVSLAHGYTEAEYARQNDEMIYNRNASWIPAIEKMHAAGGGFFAVGALHLIGKRSVLDLLQAKGYKVTRVTLNTAGAPPSKK